MRWNTGIHLNIARFYKEILDGLLENEASQFSKKKKREYGVF